jgi:hypothetical protein
MYAVFIFGHFSSQEMTLTIPSNSRQALIFKRSGKAYCYIRHDITLSGALPDLIIKYLAINGLHKGMPIAERVIRHGPPGGGSA